MKNRPRQHPATAHFPLLGSARCGGCVSFMPFGRKHENGRCLKWAEFKGMAYRFEAEYRAAHPEDWWRPLPSIPRGTLACKYYAAKPEEEPDASTHDQP
jgi:hypothetical protein